MSELNEKLTAKNEDESKNENNGNPNESASINSKTDEKKETERFQMPLDINALKSAENEDKQKKDNCQAVIFSEGTTSKPKIEKNLKNNKTKAECFSFRDGPSTIPPFLDNNFFSQNYSERCGPSTSFDVITYSWEPDAKKNPTGNDSHFAKNVFSDGRIQTNLKPHSSFTCLASYSEDGLKMRLSSLTSIQTPPITWQDLTMTDNSLEKRLNLQISKSSKDNTRRKFKRDDLLSVSDSELLFDSDNEGRKSVKKCDKKSRGDSMKRETELANRKQVQWKTEVDVIYFSSHLIPEGEQTGEVIGRVVEPLREEWEQQRQNLYNKMMDSRWISLLKI